MQALDTRLDQLAHGRAALPQLRQLADLEAEATIVGRELALARSAYQDIQGELAKSEADVQLVRDRAARDRARLDAGTGTAKDLQALQHELTSLARRQSELEDLEIEVMERAEALETQVSALQARREALDAQVADVELARDEATARIDAETDRVRTDRDVLAPQVGEQLLALYQKIRASSGGIGAAELRQRRCGGCQLELNQVDLGRIKSAPPDEVLRCEECRRILVRTPESGLP
ncbi:MAG: zinc ribbon domain-containing protein [Dermatophilaceae bacterium]